MDETMLLLLAIQLVTRHVGPGLRGSGQTTTNHPIRLGDAHLRPMMNNLKKYYDPNVLFEVSGLTYNTFKKN